MGTTASLVHPRNISIGTEQHGAIPSVSEDKGMEPNQFVTDWMKGEELLARFLERGDLVEIRRGSYTHWVVYIGRTNEVPLVIHISTESSDLGVSTKKEFGKKLLEGCAALVRSDPFMQVASSDLCRVNNSLDVCRRPFPPTIVVERALTRLGTGGYNLMRNNCEHFAKWCRYALRESDQSVLGYAGIVGVTAMAASASIPVGLAVGASSFLMLKTKRAIRRRFRVWSLI